MGAKHSKSSKKPCKSTTDLDIADTSEEESFSHSQKVFHFHLSKFQFPPKTKGFNYDKYLDGISRDFHTLDKEYQLVVTTDQSNPLYQQGRMFRHSQ
ncbi:hypothetical protein ABK040_005288 [Willaertia magna]